MSPLGLIRAMLEPCESRGQAVLSAACFTIIGLAISAGAFACFQFAQAARETIPQMDFDDAYSRSRSGLDVTMYRFYTFSAVLALGALFMFVCGVVVLIRSLFPTNTAE